MYVKFFILLLGTHLSYFMSNAMIIPKNMEHSLTFFPFSEHTKQEMGKHIVLKMSELLPKFDTVGHDILSSNHAFIQDVLDNDLLSHETKKSIILFSIKLAQYGDDMGSHILQQYYNIVESSL
uniref:Uncharacterized protein n=1 Tax=viral metagenome TaxID=1070528 RepID=A0A6C0KL87_9ZZZZ